MFHFLHLEMEKPIDLTEVSGLIRPIMWGGWMKALFNSFLQRLKSLWYVTKIIGNLKKVKTLKCKNTFNETHLSNLENFHCTVPFIFYANIYYCFGEKYY